MLKERTCGILLHITSLPSQFGIGDLGPEAYSFADFMVQSGLTYWQILPLSPVEGSSGYSPYSGLSAFAGNPMLISPILLMDEGYIEQKDLKTKTNFPKDRVEFESAIAFKKTVLNKAFESFEQHPTDRQVEMFKKFCEENKVWLNDFAEYMALKNHFDLQAWFQWPSELRDREKGSLKEMRKKLKRDIQKEKFLQFVFFQQWETLKLYCNDRGIRFFGDIPIYVGYDSADVWANPEIFRLNEDKSLQTVAGVPPDYFSESGQLWGMPIFDWKALKEDKYDWWMKRMSQNFNLFDLVRLDHFRAFSAYWEVPAGETTAINGRWVEGPGEHFFKKLSKKYPDMPIVAEDLGDIDQPVYDLMDNFDLPGMKVLLFAIGYGMPQNAYIPHHHIKNSVVYTGTHDNNTCRGWFVNTSQEDKDRLAAYLNRNVNEKSVAANMIRMAMGSVSNLCVIPAQDFLGLGQEAMMNKPSTPHGNWVWRMQPNKANEKLARHIHDLLNLYDRYRPATHPSETA